LTRELWAGVERSSLSDLLDEVGPDAPTLCTGWNTAALAAHLVSRESSLLAGAGTLGPALAPAGNRAMARALRRSFAENVHRFRRGGMLSQTGRLGEALHLLEFVVHREDVRRAQPHPGRQANDGADAVRDAAVFEQLRRRAGRLGRTIPAGIGLLVRSSRHGAIDVRRGPAVIVADGDPVDLALWLFGRAEASAVAIELHGGPDEMLSLVEVSLRRSGPVAK
jgi:uncharacterized protein (TIGR03085 family)